MSFCSYTFFAFHSKSFLFVLTCYWKKTSKVLRHTLCNRSLGTNMGAQSHLIPVSLCDTIYELTLSNYRVLGCKFTGPLAFCTQKAHSRLSHTRTGTKQAPLHRAFSRTELWQECAPHSAYTAYVLSGSKAGDSLTPILFPFQDLM